MKFTSAKLGNDARPILWCCISSVLVVLALNAARLTGQRYLGWAFDVHPSTQFVPYTVTLNAIRREAGAGPKVIWEEVYALRSDGAFVKLERGVRAGGAYVRREIISPGRRRIVLDDVRETKTTYELPEPSRYLRDPSSDCINARTGRPISGRGETLIGYSLIAGYRVAQLKSQLSLSSYAPELGCALLYGSTDKAQPQYMEKVLSSVVAAEPDPVLFLVPSRFVEVNEAGDR